MNNRTLHTTIMATRRSTRNCRKPKKLEEEIFLPGANNGYCAGRDMDFGRDIDDSGGDTRFGSGFYNSSNRRHDERRRRQEWMTSTTLPDADSSEEEFAFSESDEEEGDWEDAQERDEKERAQQEQAESDVESDVEDDWNGVTEMREKARLQRIVERQRSITHQQVLSNIPSAAASMDKKIKKKTRRISWGDVTIHWQGKAQQCGGSTKLHDGISSDNDAFATFLGRILGQTGESGQGFLNKLWSDSWSPQVAWTAVDDQNKKVVARLLIDFFDRFSATRSGSITKLEDVSRSAGCDMKIVPRKKVYILPGGGSSIALSANNSDHSLWVDKIKQSVTGQAILRNFSRVQ